MKRKLLCLAAALLLVLGLFPGAALAQGEDVIPDEGLKKAINEALNAGKPDDEKRPVDAVVTEADMKGLSRLSVYSEDGVKSLEGLQYAVNLTSLSIKGTVEGLEEIEGLAKLTQLTITDNDSLGDLTVLGKKPELTKLTVSSNDNMVSLDGLSGTACPMLQELDCSRCKNLSDISALANHSLPSLRIADFEGYNAISDISALKGYTSLEELELEKVVITDGNRMSYRAAVSSLTNLKELSMPYCEISDEDTVMFAPLKKLESLVLNINNLTNTEFCDSLPDTMITLGLHGNNIADMDNLARFKNLEILGMGDNMVTDFSFTSGMTALTAEDVRHAEGIKNYPMRETYRVGSPDAPVEIEGNQIVIDNPYIGADGTPISFKGAETDPASTVSYDSSANEIIVTNPSTSRLNPTTVTLKYNLPVSGGEHKVSRLVIQVYAKEKVSYTISYDWGTEVPEGAVLPADSQEYDNLSAAQAALDSSFTNQTKIRGEKDGKEGVWQFSGWTTTLEDGVLKAVGQWTFAADVPETTEEAESSETPETTEAEESSEMPETTKAEESSEAPEITKAEESSETPETTKAEESSGMPETTKAEESTAVPETTAAPEAAADGKTPPTGDAGNGSLWGSLFAVSAVGVLTAVLAGKGRRKKA